MPALTYKSNLSPSVTHDFENADQYGKVKLGTDYLFWKKSFSWQYVPITDIKRVYRRVEAVDTKVCCCNVNFDIQKLIVELKDETVCELLIGEGIASEAEALFSSFKKQRPELSFGKV